MDVLKKELVKQFLKETKYLISNGNYEIVNRDKTFRTMALLGIDFETIKEIILSLTPKDYFNGPEEDRNRPEEFIWEFGKIFDNREELEKNITNHGVFINGNVYGNIEFTK